MAQRVVIPLYPGVKGNMKDFPYTVQGQPQEGRIYWITPIAVYTPDGLSVSALKTSPTVREYIGALQFEVWDKLRQATPKKVATIKVDATTGKYEVAVEEQYMHHRLQLEFNLHTAAPLPHESQAFRNKTHHGDWEYRDKV